MSARRNMVLSREGLVRILGRGGGGGERGTTDDDRVMEVKSAVGGRGRGRGGGGKLISKRSGDGVSNERLEGGEEGAVYV